MEKDTKNVETPKRGYRVLIKCVGSAYFKTAIWRRDTEPNAGEIRKWIASGIRKGVINVKKSDVEEVVLLALEITSDFDGEYADITVTPLDVNAVWPKLSEIDPFFIVVV